MGDVIDLDAQRPHAQGPARCLQCGHTWHAVVPEAAGRLPTRMDCPACACHTGVWDGLFNQHGPIWVCECDNDAFTITPAGAVCLRCGTLSVEFPPGVMDI